MSRCSAIAGILKSVGSDQGVFLVTRWHSSSPQALFRLAVGKASTANSTDITLGLEEGQGLISQCGESASFPESSAAVNDETIMVRTIADRQQRGTCESDP